MTEETRSTPDLNANAISLIVQMQEKQLAMQEQMTQLMSRLLPNPPADSATLTRNTRSKPPRPTIQPDCSDNQWMIFTDAWKRYKTMAGLVDADEIRNELRSTCEPAVNAMLFNFVGPTALDVATETQLLSHIKSVVVKSVHHEVYRQQFFSLRQDAGESITHFISRLKSQAMLCDFNKICPCVNRCNTSYSEEMIMSQIISGLYDLSHQTKILNEMSQVKDLNDMTERLLVLEASHQACNHLRPSANQDIIAPIRSSYQKAKMSNTKTHETAAAMKPSQNSYPCIGCGRTRHPKGRRQCPAQGHRCNNCGKLNHFANVCKGSKINNITDSAIDDPADVSLLSSVTDSPSL